MLLWLSIMVRNDFPSVLILALSAFFFSPVKDICAFGPTRVILFVSLC